MGLDHYLYRQIDPEKSIDFDEGDALWLTVTDQFGEIDYSAEPSAPNSYESFRRDYGIARNLELVVQWRKFNALHRWFEVACNGGNETNCDWLPVSLEQLAGLLTTLKRVAANHELAPEVLPTQEGFFFGSTDYDESYLQDVDETIEALEKLLAEEAVLHAQGRRPRQFFYYSWW